MSTSDSDDHALIDRHLAGILEPAETAQLEELIRTSPDWAQRYREAEELARLVCEGVGRGGVPVSAKRAIRDRISAAQTRPAVRSFTTRRRVLVAAAVLVALAGAYLFAPKDSQYIEPLYAAEPLPLTDLARSSDVLLVGAAEDAGGTVRFRLDETLYGDAAGRACALPDSVRAGQRIALFGSYRGDESIEVVGGARGVVHLDGAQRWEGRLFQPAVVRRRIERSSSLRTLSSALGDLERFLVSDASLIATTADGDLRYSAPLTALYLGRFDVSATRKTLMRLIMAKEKHPQARNAGAEALVDADPLGTCRMLLALILAQPIEGLHAESEDGYVVLSCLRLMQRSGNADLAENLRKLTARVRCPSLKRAAEAALLAVEGKGPRTPGVLIAPVPQRLVVHGREGVVIPGCQGHASPRLVLFRGEAGLGDLNLLVNLAVSRGHCVVVLPRDTVDAAGWLGEAERSNLVKAGETTFLGLGRGSQDAVRAARMTRPDRLLLVGPLAAVLEQVPEGLAAHAWPVDGAPAPSTDVTVHQIDHGELADLLADKTLWMGVLAAD